MYLEKKTSKTLPGPLFKGHEVTQDETDFDKDKKVSSTIEGRGLTTMHVTSHPLLDTPPKFDNNRYYKGDTHDETPVSIKKYPNVLKKDLLETKGNLEKETDNATNEEYVPSEHLKGENIKYHTQENIINRLLSKRFTNKLIDMMLSKIITYDTTMTSDDYVEKKIKAKVKWNQINPISMESVLGSNCRIPLLHMSKRKVYIEVTNERINEFSFAYMYSERT